MSYSVFIDRPRDSSPAAVRQLVEAIAQRYRLPATAIAGRLAAGRFRVKADVTHATARAFAEDLERLGAVCSVEEVSSPGDAHGFDARTPPPLAAATASPDAGPSYTSGLAAAEGEPARSAQAMGVLQGSIDGAALSLQSLDGQAPAEPRRGDDAIAGGRDLFAPPEIDEDEALELATPAPPAAAKAASITRRPAPVAQPQLEPGLDDDLHEGAFDRAAGMARRVRVAIARRQRLRFAVGVYVLLLVGFVPAHLLASVRERSSYGEIDREVDQRGAEATTMEAWDRLQEFRSESLQYKRDQKLHIVIISVIIWAFGGAAIGFAWFYKIDWERWA